MSAPFLTAAGRSVDLSPDYRASSSPTRLWALRAAGGCFQIDAVRPYSGDGSPFHAATPLLAARDSGGTANVLAIRQRCASGSSFRRFPAAFQLHASPADTLRVRFRVV